MFRTEPALLGVRAKGHISWRVSLGLFFGAFMMSDARLYDDDRLFAGQLTPRQRFDALFGERTESQVSKPRPPMLWVSLAHYYIDQLETKRASETYVANVSRVIDRFTKYCNLYDTAANEVAQADLQRYVRTRSDDQYALNSKSPARPIGIVTINNEIAILNSIFKLAGPKLNVRGHRENLGLMEHPPYFAPLDEPDPCPVDVTREQLAEFIQATKNATSPRRSVCDPQHFWLAVLVLDSITAVRREALLSIPRPDHKTLNEKRRIVLPAELAKNKTGQVISLGTRDDVVSLLSSLPSRPGEPLLPWKSPSGKRLSLSHFNSAMKRFQVKAGINQATLLKTKHLRSTAASQILDAQFNTDTARKRLGHKSDDVIVKHYLTRRVMPSDENASDHLADFVMSMIDYQPAERATLPLKSHG